MSAPPRLSWFTRIFFPWIERQWQQEADVQEKLNAISIEHAEQLAKALLWDSSRFRVLPTSVPWAGIGHASVVRLFAGAEAFDEIRGDLRLARSEIAESDLLPGWDRIGEDIEHAEVFVHRTTGEAIESDGDRAALARETTYPSIFHLIVRRSWDVATEPRS